MRQFIQKTIASVVLFTLGIILFVFATHYVMKTQFDFSFSKKNKHVIVGHSHPECAFNDALIPGFKNLGESGEGYFYTYQKVRQLIAQNEIKNIYIEFSNNLIDEHMDDWIWGDEKMNNYVPLYAPFMDKEDFELLYEKNSTDFMTALSTSTRKNIAKVLSLDFKMGQGYGGYNKLERNKIPELLLERKTKPDTVKKKGLSEVSISYLEKMVDYCQESGVNVIFIRSPQHSYYNRDNEEDLMRIKRERFAEIDFLDFDKFSLGDDEFGDFGHLNHHGAKIFSAWFADLIDDGLLEQDNKASYVASAIALHNKNKVLSP